MYALNFEYDGKLLSDYGFIVCQFSDSSGVDTVDVGQTMTFNKVAMGNGKYYNLTGIKYENCIETSFEICKDPCIYKDLTITPEEYRDIVRWLNRPNFCKFRIYDVENELEPCYYEASFNVGKINVGGKLCGITLDMTTNRPFGLGKERIFRYKFTDPSDSFVVEDFSDEVGYIYPYLKIICEESGDLTISNDLTDCQTVLRNCVENEEIIFTGQTFDVSTTASSHDVYNDFNYDYFKIGNTFNNRNNKITVSKKCDIEIRYSPIIKNLPV